MVFQRQMRGIDVKELLRIAGPCKKMADMTKLMSATDKVAEQNITIKVRNCVLLILSMIGKMQSGNAKNRNLYSQSEMALPVFCE